MTIPGIIPKFISVDDHVVEPQDLWQSRLPARFLDEAPRVKRLKGRVVYDAAKQPGFEVADGPDSRWCDVWHYEETVWPLHAAYAAVGPTSGLAATTALT